MPEPTLEKDVEFAGESSIDFAPRARRTRTEDLLVHRLLVWPPMLSQHDKSAVSGRLDRRTRG
jgi:hypothetical protein